MSERESPQPLKPLFNLIDQQVEQYPTGLPQALIRALLIQKAVEEAALCVSSNASDPNYDVPDAAKLLAYKPDNAPISDGEIVPVYLTPQAVNELKGAHNTLNWRLHELQKSLQNGNSLIPNNLRVLL